jgi:hypothetical protein
VLIREIRVYQIQLANFPQRGYPQDMNRKPANKQQSGISALLFLGVFLVGCETQYDSRFYITGKIDEHMARTEAHQLQQMAFFSFAPPKGKDWAFMKKTERM